MELRKQVYHLLPADIEAFPVWEFALDEEEREGQDEATVRPCQIDGALDPADGMFIVRTRFTLADGSICYGYLTPPATPDSGPGILQPVIVTPDGQISFWCGIMAPSAEEVAQQSHRISTNVAAIFPIAFESIVPLKYGPVTGTLPGFLVLENPLTGEIRIVT